MAQESVETTVARLDERLIGFQEAFKTMADDQRRMAESYEKLVESNHRVALLESDMVSAKRELAKLWEKYDFMEAARIAAEQRRLQEELKAKNKWIWEAAKVSFSALVAIALYKMGIHQS